MDRGFSVAQRTYSMVLAVKNTFIHISSIENDELPRSVSDPIQWIPGEFQRRLVEATETDFETDMWHKLDVEADAMNKVVLSLESGGRYVSGESVATSAGSTKQASSDGHPSIADQTVGYAADDSTNELSASDHDLDSSKRVRDRCPSTDSWGEGVTTVMIRQVPRECTQRKLLAEVSSRGFEGLFDYIYIPFDFKKGVNVGYGFINFVEPTYAQAFRDAFDGNFLDHQMVHKNKPLRVHQATLQGYEANLRHFVETKTGQHRDPQYSPLFLPQEPKQDGRGNASGKTFRSTALASWVTIDGVSACSPQLQAQLATPPSWQYFCLSCGAPHNIPDNFCASCGTRLEHHQFLASGSKNSGGHSLADAQP